jgi:xylulokinase
MVAEHYIVSHDLGTSSDKALLVTMNGEITGIAQRKYPLQHPEPGFAEQDPVDLWAAVAATTKEVIEKTGIPAASVAAITFSSQMQGLIPVASDGTVLYPSITWLDGRAAGIIHEKLWTQPRIQGYNIFRLLKFLRITGGTPGHTGKDQIGKILWLQEHKPQIFEKVVKFLDVKDYILYRLTGKFVTSVDLAVIWWLLDTRRHRNQWHAGLCRLAGVTPDQLSQVKGSAEIAGNLTAAAARELGLTEKCAVVNGAGDMSAAALGSGAIEEGELHISVGTSSWVGGHVIRRKTDITHYAGCIGSALPERYYLAMAHQETAGLCLEWLKDRILYDHSHDPELDETDAVYRKFDQAAALSPPGAGKLIFTPWMFGERCPLDDEHVRGGFFNLTLSHTRSDLIRAVFEGIAMNTRWAMETLENLYHPVAELNIIGGGAKSNIWCQIFADVLNRGINQISEPQHAGARGAALLAGFALGHLKSVSEIKSRIPVMKRYTPDPANRALYDDRFLHFKALYRQNRLWFRRINRMH